MCLCHVYVRASGFLERDTLTAVEPVCFHIPTTELTHDDSDSTRLLRVLLTADSVHARLCVRQSRWQVSRMSSVSVSNTAQQRLITGWVGPYPWYVECSMSSSTSISGQPETRTSTFRRCEQAESTHGRPCRMASTWRSNSCSRNSLTRLQYRCRVENGHELTLLPARAAGHEPKVWKARRERVVVTDGGAVAARPA